MQQRFADLPAFKRKVFHALLAANKRLTRRRPNLALSRLLLKQVHQAFGGELRALFVGGAFTEPQTLQFFYDLGFQVANGYGLTEAGTAVTLNDFNPVRTDTVGRPLPGVELRIVEPDAEGIGEVAVRSKTVMSHYLDDPELTAETIVDGWLMTGDFGRIDAAGHLQLLGRKKNMIVTAEGKNIYPGRHRECVCRAAGEGILRLCGELYLAAADDGGRTTGAGAPSGTGARGG